jgi:hypothetical protein
MKCNDCKNYDPKEPKPKTTVTVWWEKGLNIIGLCDESVSEGRRNKPFAWCMYTFSGTPDIDRVIRETLDKKGALAVKIECTVDFKIDYWGITPFVYIWKRNSLNRAGDTYCHNENFIVANCLTPEEIEQAITEHLSKQKEQVIKVGARCPYCNKFIIIAKEN